MGHEEGDESSTSVLEKSTFSHLSGSPAAAAGRRFTSAPSATASCTAMAYSASASAVLTALSPTSRSSAISVVARTRASSD